MQLSVSNLAWDRADDAKVASLLTGHGIHAIDVAPGKYFDLSRDVSQGEVESVGQWWADRGITIVGMQALLFGTTGLNLFGPEDVRERMLAQLTRVCRIGGWLGARKLTFGSPANRDRSGLDDTVVRSTAVEFFRRLGAAAERNGVVVSLEPNPPRYRCNFMTTTAEAASVVAATAHPGIRLQLDTGAMFINGEDPAVEIGRVREMVGHIHASEPDLVPLGSVGNDHGTVARVLEQSLPGWPMTVEMLRPQGAAGPAWMGAALEFAVGVYGGGKSGDNR